MNAMGRCEVLYSTLEMNLFVKESIFYAVSGIILNTVGAP